MIKLCRSLKSNQRLSKFIIIIIIYLKDKWFKMEVNYYSSKILEIFL